MKFIEYKELLIPKEIMDRLLAQPQDGKPVTLTSAGFFDWMNELSKKEGWRIVWRTFSFNSPYFIVERERDVDLGPYY